MRAMTPSSFPDEVRIYTCLVGRTTTTEAVVLRSLRLGEADRVLHLYTLHNGRVGAVAKGIRKTRSRFGARLEPLSHVQILLHEGRGELHTVTGVDLIHSHQSARDEPYRLGVALAGAEAMLKLFTEQEANERAFRALTRFLDLADDVTPHATEPRLDPLALSFQLKLLWLAGYLPHLETCAECGADGPLAGYSASAGGAVCRACGAGAIPLSPQALQGIGELLRRPLAEAGEAGLRERAAREALRVVIASHEYHGGFRLRTLAG
jgi:DNA repair protein RecO (recombination protein O)